MNHQIYNKLTHIDLFSGIGGFALAAKWAGFKTIQFVEIDSFCKKILKKHWPYVPIHDDIKTFNFIDKVDLLTGGFPCQPFSTLGHKHEKKDDRYLWHEFYRIIQQSHPSWIIIENVVAILRNEVNTIINDLENENYSSQIYNIPACGIGANHKRNRTWIVANTNSKSSLETNTAPKSIENEWRAWMGLARQAWVESSRYWKENKPPIHRMDDGLPYWVDRNKSLGNAIVPQVIYPVMKMIYEIEMFDLL